MADRDEVLVINMQEGRMWGDCAMCGQYKRLDHAVKWDCGPVHYETDGGMVVCRECHDWHYTADHAPRSPYPAISPAPPRRPRAGERMKDDR